jgi:hypothetical protein
MKKLLSSFCDQCNSSTDAGYPPQIQTTAPSLRAELIGTDHAAAAGIEAHSPSPILNLCRALVEAGCNPAMPLHTLALRVRSIGEAAGLEVNGDGAGFRPATKPGRAPLVGQNEEASPQRRRLAVGRRAAGCKGARYEH